MGRGLVWIGIAVFVISWFVPVMKGQDLLGAAPAAIKSIGDAGGEGSLKVTGPGGTSDGLGDGPSWLPGWQACRFAWELLTEGAQDGKDDAWKARVCGSTCLTNVLMVVAALVLLAGRGRQAGLGMLLLLAAALNASWIYLLDGESTSVLSVGYYLWAGSFLLVGVGALARSE